ncbi:MAG: DUF2510 domain-containing protein [Acidimicrobiales bacterium]
MERSLPSTRSSRRAGLPPDGEVSARPSRQASPLPQSGWYPDPRGEAPLRWWTGEAWSDALHDGQYDAGQPATEAAIGNAPH